MADSVQSIDTSRIEKQISDVNLKVDTLIRSSNEINSSVAKLKKDVDEANRNLKELQEQFIKMMKDRERAEVIQRAATELIRVRQEIEQEYGEYAVVRKNMIGVLQATDVALVRKETISNVSEELMLSTPNYWLSPCLIAIAAWIDNNRALADRAIREAVRRNPEKTALTMALICRRNGRTDTCYEWLAMYFSHQSADAFSEGALTYIDAYVNGVFGVDSKHICDDYVAKWINQIKNTDVAFESHQTEKWKDYYDGYSKSVSAEYPALSKVPEFRDIDSYIARLNAAKLIKAKYGSIANADIDQGLLKRSIDEKLVSLIKNYDDAELALREEETLYVLEKEYGDEKMAKSIINRKRREKMEATVNMVEQMTNVVMDRGKNTMSEKKTAVTFLRTYMQKGYEDYIDEKKESFPDGITLSYDEWNLKVMDISQKDMAMVNYENHMRQKENEAVAAAAKGKAKLWMVLAAILGVAGLVFCFTVLPLGIIMLAGAVYCGINILTDKKKTSARIQNVHNEYDQRIAAVKSDISATVEQWNATKCIAENFEKNADNRMVV